MDDGYIAVLCRKKTSVKKGLRPLGKISLLNLVIWVGRRPQLRRDCDSYMITIRPSSGLVGRRPQLRRDCDHTIFG